MYVGVRTTTGAIVNTGILQINGNNYKLNKYGLVKISLPMDMTYAGMNGFYSTIYYKKAASKLYTIRYIPSTIQFKASAAKIKYTELYRCTSCGKTTSHAHSDGRVFIVS
ncbi:hypothetical protein [Methanobrevibacter sp.]|uniref:hypothetical protein n=1 Tax=Methanobrevibacter sp. TaxID=66852 RepID=UPI0026DFA4FF|nr:hypothetical protein [Methanobrevibacter sp.]MDO5859471.1 hypothetical protein [Methanobrevibacter sp.]